MRLQTTHHLAARWGSSAGLLAVLLASLLVAFVATAAGPTAEGWLFQSPVSPIQTAPVQIVAEPEETAAGPALVSVPSGLNFAPWLIGLAVIVVIVGGAMWWRGRREEGGVGE
jgi:type IV secretory pathway VirB2 component (pilin)